MDNMENGMELEEKEFEIKPKKADQGSFQPPGPAYCESCELMSMLASTPGQFVSSGPGRRVPASRG